MFRDSLSTIPAGAGQRPQGALELVEMQRNRRRAMCCGGGGGRSFMEEHQGKRISAVRLEQARETGAGTVAAGCPFCITMFEDGIKTGGWDGQMQVKDISELIVAALPKDAPAAPSPAAAEATP